MTGASDEKAAHDVHEARVRAAETTLAVRNAFILGMSLLATWAVALVVRLVLPRMLGPERFGAYNFADTFAFTSSVLFTFGVDTYVQKEIPARPEHASDFLGGVTLIRTLVAGFVLAAMELVVWRSHRSAEVQLTVLVFGIGQLSSTFGTTAATLLYASRTVGRLAVYNVTSKMLWASGVGIALFADRGLPWFASAYVVSETVRTAMLWHTVRKKLGATLRIDMPETKKVLKASLPYFVNDGAINVYSKIDVSIMALLTTNVEVGWYGAAGNIANMALLMAPLMGWVLMPQLSRAAARSYDELLEMFRRSMELVLVLALPVSMMLGLSADVVVRLAFGGKFAESALALELLAPMFVLTYVAMLIAKTLILLGRGWTTTMISVASVPLNAALNLFLLRPMLAWLGPGGAGATASAISVATEIVVAAAMLYAIGRQAYDRSLVTCTLKALGACAACIALHVALAGIGPARLILDIIAYAAIVTLTGALKVRALYTVIRDALSSRRGRNAEA